MLIRRVVGIGSLCLIIFSCAQVPSEKTRTPAEDPHSQLEGQWNQIAPAYDFTPRKFSKAKTKLSWQLLTYDKLIYTNGIKASYWQALPPMPASTVFDIADKVTRDEEIKKRISENDTKLGGTGGCLPGMVRVKGEAHDWEETVKRQESSCLDSASWDKTKLCKRFKQVSAPSDDKKTPMDFCIDRYEFPNIPGEYPATMVIFSEARAICKAQGKRLCSENEWTFACEGVDAKPYPSGYNRYSDADAPYPRLFTDEYKQLLEEAKDSPEAQKELPKKLSLLYPKMYAHGDECNNDVPPPPNASMKQLNQPKFESASKLIQSVEALDQLWAAETAGARSLCKSDFGVYDLTGNVDEWTTHSEGRPKEKESVLKGGFWGPVRTRCQPATVSHGDGYMNYQSSFRCCADIE